MKKDTYDRVFYEKSIRPDRISSYKTIAEYLNKVYCPNSVIDYGCGCGWILLYLKKLGAERIFGIEPSAAAMEVQMNSVVRENVLQEYLHKPLEISFEYFDMAVCIEVAEHIEGIFSDILVSNITDRSDFLIFSAAPPGQDGVGHVNEQPWEYWSNKFHNIGFVEKEEETATIQQHLRKNRVKSWYSNNIRVLRRK